MSNQTEGRPDKGFSKESNAYSRSSTPKEKLTKILLIIVFVAILVGVIRVVRYTKHNLPPSTALLPVPTETLERQAGEGGNRQKGK